MLPNLDGYKSANIDIAVGSSIHEILRKAKEVSADLVVLGVHGADHAALKEDHGVGTLAVRCLRMAPTEVMLVHSGHDRAFRTIVAAIDFSEQSADIVKQARRVAYQDHSEIHFVHVMREYSSPLARSSAGALGGANHWTFAVASWLGNSRGRIR